MFFRDSLHNCLWVSEEDKARSSAETSSGVCVELDRLHRTESGEESGEVVCRECFVEPADVNSAVEGLPSAALGWPEDAGWVPVGDRCPDPVDAVYDVDGGWAGWDASDLSDAEVLALERVHEQSFGLFDLPSFNLHTRKRIAHKGLSYIIQGKEGTIIRVHPCTMLAPAFGAKTNSEQCANED